MESSLQEPSEITFRDVFPKLSDEELKEAERNFRRYLEVATKIYAERSPFGGMSDFDTPQISPTMKERSNPSLKI